MTVKGRPTTVSKISKLESQVEELQDALKAERSQKETLGVLTGLQTGTTMVPVRNYSEQNIGLHFLYQGNERSIVLMPRGSGSLETTMIPLDYWNELITNDLVTLGLIARTDLPIDNPNIIEDRDEFFDTLVEADVVKVIQTMSRPGLLRALILHWEQVPKEERTSKHKLLLDALRTRVFEVSKVRVVETDEDIGI